MPDDIPKDLPLLQCWLKKSWSTSKKVGLYLGVVAIIYIAGYIAWLGLTSQTTGKIWLIFIGWCNTIYTALIVVVASVPWEIWVAIAVFAIILIHSSLWCIARKLTDEDWESSKANAVAPVAVAVAPVAVAADPVDKKTIGYYIFRFVGAYRNYRNRIKQKGV